MDDSSSIPIPTIHNSLTISYEVIHSALASDKWLFGWNVVVLRSVPICLSIQSKIPNAHEESAVSRTWALGKNTTPVSLGSFARVPCAVRLRCFRTTLMRCDHNKFDIVFGPTRGKRRKIKITWINTWPCSIWQYNIQRITLIGEMEKSKSAW